MALRLGDTAPNFSAETTEGPINFHEWLGNSWGVLFSHPKNFTPVCTTELGECALLKPEFDRRDAKMIGLSGDATKTHKRCPARIMDKHGPCRTLTLTADPRPNCARVSPIIQ